MHRAPLLSLPRNPIHNLLTINDLLLRQTPIPARFLPWSARPQGASGLTAIRNNEVAEEVPFTRRVPQYSGPGSGLLSRVPIMNEPAVPSVCWTSWASVLDCDTFCNFLGISKNTLAMRRRLDSWRLASC